MVVPTASYLLLVIRGLEHVAIEEIQAKLQVESISILTLQEDRSQPQVDVTRGEAAVGKILLRTSSSPAQVKSLCSIQAFLVYLAHTNQLDTKSEQGVDEIEKLVEQATTWPAALELWKQHHADSTFDMSSIRFRASSVRDGNHVYSSDAISKQVGAAVVRLQKWPVSLVEFQLEVVCIVIHHQMVCGISLAENPQVVNFRGGRLAPEVRRIPSLKYISTLRPSTAYMMLKLAQCTPGDVVLDCMCGVGTLPACSVLWAPVFGLGGDMCTDAITQANVNVQGSHASVCKWNSQRLPLRDECIDRIVVDMPFGLRCGTSSKNSRLYPKALREMARVLHPQGRIGTSIASIIHNFQPRSNNQLPVVAFDGGEVDANVGKCSYAVSNVVLVLLVMSKKLLVHSVRNTSNLTISETIPVNIGGLGVALYILEKKPTQEIPSSTKRKLSEDGRVDQEISKAPGNE